MAWSGALLRAARLQVQLGAGAAGWRGGGANRRAALASLAPRNAEEEEEGLGLGARHRGIVELSEGG
jgi:hypothetical protein